MLVLDVPVGHGTTGRQGSAGPVDSCCPAWLDLPSEVHSHAPEGFRHMGLSLSTPSVPQIKQKQFKMK